MALSRIFFGIPKLIVSNSSPSPRISWCDIRLSQWRRSFSHGSVSLVISPQGTPKFETHETDPPKKEKWKTKKKLKQQKMREKKKRKAANKRDPRRLTVKGKKHRQRFATAEERIKYKIENAKVKEGLLVERLKRYEVDKAEGPVIKPLVLTGEELFYKKKIAQKRSNYVPIGRQEYLEELFLTCTCIGRNMKLSTLATGPT